MIEQIVNNWLNGIEQDLIKNYNRLGLRASGEWEKSLEQFTEVKSGKLKAGILGNDYTYFMENGRGPNKDQNPETLKKWVGWAGSTFLDKWVKDKRINVDPFAAAYSIARRGIQVPNRYNAGGLVSDVVTKQRVYELNKSLIGYFAEDLKSTIIKTFK